MRFCVTGGARCWELERPPESHPGHIAAANRLPEPKTVVLSSRRSPVRIWSGASLASRLVEPNWALRAALIRVRSGGSGSRDYRGDGVFRRLHLLSNRRSRSSWGGRDPALRLPSPGEPSRKEATASNPMSTRSGASRLLILESGHGAGPSTHRFTWSIPAAQGRLPLVLDTLADQQLNARSPWGFRPAPGSSAPLAVCGNR